VLVARSELGGKAADGVVERVRTSEKARFHGLETLSRAVTSLLWTGPEGN
jgi:hypothetical protein